MDLKQNKTLALLSIHPKYAAQILSGEKRVEFRKKPFRNGITHAVIYATFPVQRIVGYFEITSSQTATPDQIWSEFNAIGGISESDFDLYYAGSEKAVAIGIGSPVQLTEPMRLDEVASALKPPQSFQYLSIDLLQKFESRSGFNQVPQDV